MDYEVRFLPSERTLRVPQGESLLAAVRRAGLPIARACGAHGLCARCAVEIVHGAERVAPEQSAETRAKRAGRVDPERRLACRVAVEGDLHVRAPYW